MTYGDVSRDDEPKTELAKELLDRCQLLVEGSPQWRYLTQTRGIPAKAVRYCGADLRALEPPIPGFDQLARGVVSLLRDSKGELTGLAVEACGIAGERVLGKDGRTARKCYALRKRCQIEAVFRVDPAGKGATICYAAEGRLAKPLAVAAVFDDPAIIGWGGLFGLGRCLPPEPTVIVIEDARPADPVKAAEHDEAMARGCDRLMIGGSGVQRAGGPKCECCKDVDEVLAKHGVEDVRAWFTASVPAELSLDGLARKCAAIGDPLKRAEAVAEAIKNRGLRKQGLTKGFREAVDRYAGGYDDEAEAAPATDAPLVEDVLPWPAPVLGSEVLDAVVAVITRHVSLPIEMAHAAALWAAHSHALDCAWFNPRLAVCSPVPRCGKTTLIEVLSGVVARPKPTAGVTPAVVFRMIDLCKPTYLVDEADGYLPDNDELRAVLNSGHTRTSATVDRLVKVKDGDWVPRSFSTWCPLVIAGIGRLPSSLDDRSIKIRLQRKPRSTRLSRFRADRTAGITELGRKLARFVVDNNAAIGAADIEPPEELHDRSADNWRPLLAIAHVAGGPWPARAEAAAKVLEAIDAEADDLCILLLEDIRTRFANRQDVRAIIESGDVERAREVRLFTKEILEYLLSRHDRPWPDYGRNNRPITERGVYALLKPFGIVTGKNVRRDNQQFKGFSLDAFLETFGRYLAPIYVSGSSDLSRPTVPPSQAAETLGKNGTDNPSHDPSQAINATDGVDGESSGTDRGTGFGMDSEIHKSLENAGENMPWDGGTLGRQNNKKNETHTSGNGASEPQPKRERKRRIRGADTTPDIKEVPK